MERFIKLTHARSGEDVYVKADSIDVVRQKGGWTLIVDNDANKGMYVTQDPALVIELLEGVVIE